MKLYETGASTSCQRAGGRLRIPCDDWLASAYHQLKVVDVLANPEAAEDARVIATPMPIRTGPLPSRRTIRLRFRQRAGAHRAPPSGSPTVRGRFSGRARRMADDARVGQGFRSAGTPSSARFASGACRLVCIEAE